MALTPIRETAKGLLAQVPVLGKEIRSLVDGKENKLFTTMTNTSHSAMKRDWDGYPDDNGVPTKKKGIMTGCNGFTGWFTTKLGQPVSQPLGVFELWKFLERYKMLHAWIPSTPDARPKLGDVVRWKTKYHVCVSESFDDNDIWDHCDAGQGGSQTGYDILKRVREKTAFDHEWLYGWLDIDLAFGDGAGVAQAEPTDWLETWWLVKFQGANFYYEFRKDQTCSWTTHSPILAKQSAASDMPSGRWAIGKDKQVTVNWSSGSTEKFKYVDSGSPYEETMSGVSAAGDPMSAVTYF